MKLHNKLQHLLIKAGLSEVESLVYTELLKHPIHTKWELVSRTNLPKTSVYRAIEKLQKLKMVNFDNNSYKALSPKGLIAELKHKKFKESKIVQQIQKLSPFLHMNNDSIEEIETFLTKDQITDAYLFMAEQPYNWNLDFGDFEKFIPTIGGINMACTFRNLRSKKSKNLSICTTTGSHTDYFCSKDQENIYKGKIEILNIKFTDSFIIFSDSNDYVLFNNIKDEETQSSVLIKSKVVADSQRKLFNLYSQALGKC